ncbi:MAG: hypothetical protein LAP86_19525 [Acidobacteriia bacterium]|nr:hypothetical protein [Terriglobia bacterium]
MSEQNFFGMARQVLQERNPEIFDMSGLDELLAKGAKERQALDVVNAAKRAARDGSDKPVNELARLRNELFKLELHAKHSEIYTNEIAGQVKLLETNINDALKAKKQASTAGNLGAERNCEHNIQRLEREQTDLVKEFTRARKVSAGAAVVLKEWPHRERVEELSKLVG